MLYSKNGEYLYFSHIPRTGGRYSSKVLFSNGYILDRNHARMQRRGVFIDFQETMHVKIETAYAFDPRINKSNKITVIRNPVTRFTSACNSEHIMKIFGGIENFKKLEDYDYFLDLFDNSSFSYKVSSKKRLLVNGLSNFPNNWFRKQSEFFDKTFFVWKYEDGMHKSFREFLKKIGADVDINKEVEKKYRHAAYDIKIQNFSLPEKIKKNVLRYYEEDYEFWNSY